MAAPSIKSGTGITVVETCDTGGSSPKSMSSMLSGSTINTATAWSNAFGLGINGTGVAGIYSGNDAQSGAAQGGEYALGTHVDGTVANRLFFVHLQSVNTAISDFGASAGVFFHFHSADTGAEEAAFPVTGGDLAHDQALPYIVNVNRSDDAWLYDGNFDPADVSHVGIAATFPLTFDGCRCDSYGYVDPLVLINGETGDRGTFQDFLDHSDDNDCLLYESPTSNFYYMFMHLHIGDGSTVTWFDDDGRVIEFPGTANIAGDFGRAHIEDNDLGFQINGHSSGGGLYDLTNCSFLGDNPYYFKLTGSTTYVNPITGLSVSGAGTVQIDDGYDISGQFNDCGPLECSQPTLTAVTISNASGSGLQLDTDDGTDNIASLTFDNCVVALEVDLDVDCDIDVTNITFNTNCTDYIQFNGTSGKTLTVTSPTSIDSGKLLTPNGGTITVVSPTNTFTLNSSEASSTIQIFTTNTQTILSSATGTQDTYDHSDETVDYVVQKAGFLPQRVTGFALSGSPTVTVTLVPDPVYNASHGLTRVTDYDYDEGTRELTIVAAQQGRDLYSALIDDFISETDFRNKPFPLQAIGIDRIDFTSDGTTAATINSGS